MIVLLNALNSSGQSCYAIKDESDINARLYSWDETGTLTDLGQLNTESVETMTYNGACNEIYTTSYGNFGSVNLSTGQFTVLSDLGDMNHPTLGLEDISDVDGMAIDNLSGYIYAVERKVPGDDLLFLIDPVNGTFVSNAFGPGTDYVPIPGALEDVDDIAFNPCTHELFGISTVSGSTSIFDRVVKIDINTGQATTLVTTNECDIEGLTFNNNCELFGSVGYKGCVNAGAIFKINQTTGALTEIVDINGDVEAVICCVDAPLPSPIACQIDEIITDCAIAGASLQVNPSGGTGGYTYSWSTGSTSNIISGLSVGSYSVTVEDFAGSTTTCNYQILDCTKACCENLITNGGFENFPSSFKFPIPFQGLPSQPIDAGEWAALNWVAATDADGDMWLLDDSANQVNNPEGDYFMFIQGSGDCAQICGKPSDNCNIESLLCSNWINGDTYELCFEGAAWDENFIGGNPGTPNGAGLQNGSQVVIEVTTTSGTNSYSNTTLPAASSFNNLNWVTVCATFTYNSASPIETIYITQSGSGGIFIDNVVFVNTDEPCCEVDDSVPASWNYGCNDNTTVEILGMGINGTLPATINIPNPSNVVSIIAEASFKHNENDCLDFYTSNETVSVAGFELDRKGCNSAYAYKAKLAPAASVTVDGIKPYDAQSLVLYVTRQGTAFSNSVSQGTFVNTCIYQNEHCETFTLPTQASDREIEVRIPLSDLVSDGRPAYVHLDACGVTSTTTIGTYNAGNSLYLDDITLSDVSGSCSSFEICVESPVTPNGQSLFMSGAITFTTQCCDLEAEISVNPQPACAGEDIVLTADDKNAVGTVSYLWTTGETTSSITINSLDDTTIGVTVTDSQGCEFYVEEIIKVNPVPRVEFATVDNITCFGDSDGSVNIGASKGTSPYSYQVVGVGTNTTGNFSNLNPGFYTVFVTDANGCVTESGFSVGNVAKPLTCVQDSCVRNISGNWDGNSKGPHWNGPSGTGNIQFAVQLVGPDTYLNYSVPNETLTTDNPGWFTENAAGNAALRVEFAWDKYPEDELTDIDLASDDKGKAFFTLDFTEPVSDVVLHIDRLGSQGGVITSGGTIIQEGLTNSSEWFLTTPGVVMERLSGTSDFEVSGNKFFRSPDRMSRSVNKEARENTYDGSSAGSIAIISGSPLTSLTFEVTGIGVEGLGHDDIEIAISSTVCEGEIGNNTTFVGCDCTPGTASIWACGGTPPYSFSWSNGDTGPFADNLEVGTYNVTIQDANGCDVVCSVEIEEEPGCCKTIFQNGFTRTNSRFIGPIESDFQSSHSEEGND